MAKKNTKRGFTLVELIVVLVILAILAALLIPALTGYIDKARKSQVVAETRMLTQAVQTEMSTLYASNEYATQLNAITKAFTAAAKDGKPVYEHEQKLPNLADRYNAIGLPCVSTDCSPGGARELINDGENGVIVDCGNSDALAKAMVLLLEDREKAQKMGINAKKICRRVDKELVCNRWLDFIMDCRRKENEC